MAPNVNWQPFHGVHAPRCIPRPAVLPVTLPGDPLKELQERRLLKGKARSDTSLGRHRSEILGGRAKALVDGVALHSGELKFGLPSTTWQKSRPSSGRVLSKMKCAKDAPAKEAAGKCAGHVASNFQGPASLWRRSTSCPRPDTAPVRRKEPGGAIALQAKQDRLKRRAGSAVPSVSSTVELSGGFYQALEAQRVEKEAQKQLDGLNSALASQLERLQRPTFGGKKLISNLVDNDEERLLAAVRRLDVDAGLRLKAMLVLGRIHAERNSGGIKAESLELAGLMAQQQVAVLQEPWTALDLANVFEGLGLSDTADMIFEELERDVVKGNRIHHPHILLDLAERHHSKGRVEAAERLWELACSVRPGDPRTVTRSYQWSFKAEPLVPDDKFRVMQPGAGADVALPFHRCSGGLSSDCPCQYGTAKESVAWSNLLCKPSLPLEWQLAEAVRKGQLRAPSKVGQQLCESRRSGGAPSKVGQQLAEPAHVEQLDSLPADVQQPASSPDELAPAEALHHVAFADVVGTNRLPTYVRRELDNLGFASSLATLADGGPPEDAKLPDESVKNRRQRVDGNSRNLFAPVFKGQLWKLKANCDKMDPEQWWEREMWISKNGSLVYYSKKEEQDLVYYTSHDLMRATYSVVPAESSCKPHTFLVHLAEVDGVESMPGEFAASSAELQKRWMTEMARAGQMAAKMFASPQLLAASVPFENPHATAKRFQEAEVAALTVAQSRRFQVRVVQATAGDDDADEDDATSTSENGSSSAEDQDTDP